MSSAISFSVVLIHSELIPSGAFICNEQKNLPSILPIFDVLQLCNVQFNAEVLSVTFSNTGLGSSVIWDVCTMWRAAQ